MTDYAKLTKIYETFEVTSNPESFECCSFGHINSTFFVSVNGERRYVLQKINTSIFKNPEELTENIVGVTRFLRKKVEAAGGDPQREVLHLIRNKQGTYYYRSEAGEYWRMYDYIRGTRTYQIVENPILFYNSAVAFGNFQRLLADYPAEELHETIPNFHNTVSRLEDFKKALADDKCGRAASVQKEINFVLEREEVCSFITDRIASGEYPMRVTHNDTKLNNVMIDEVTGEGICIIDLDTVMPGSVLYDFGDSIRFGASSAEEDERNLDKVYMRLELFDDYAKGFLKGLGNSLSEAEIKGLPMGALVITFETGIRFLTDYLNGDVYFATHRGGQNLDRARTQFKLVADMEKKMPEMNSIIENYL